MQSTTYHVVRVNTKDHTTYELAMDDMASIIERGFFWKKSDQPYMPVGSLLLACGTHHGRGMYLVGIVTGVWEIEPDGGEYKYRISVQWQHAIYRLPARSVDHIASLLPRWNDYFGSRNVLPGEFSQALSYVMRNATVLAPDYHWHESRAA